MEKGYKKLKKESDHENFLIVIWKEINGAVFSFFISSFIDIYTCYSFKKMLTFLSKLVSRYHKGSIFHTNYFCSTHPHPKKQKQSRGKFLFKLKIKENFNKLKWCFFYLLVKCVVQWKYLILWRWDTQIFK